VRSENVMQLDELSDAAYALLTASSLGRYIQVAKQVASRSKLRHSLASQPERISRLVSEARHAWRGVLATSERDVFEWELGILLPILAQTAVPEIDGLLRAISLSERQNAAWLGALARRLVHERAENQVGLWPWRAPTDVQPASVENRANSCPVRVLLTDGLGLRSPENRASQRTLRVAA
jgi:hypothetical protein